jgi:hypothetical protein
VTGLPFTSVSIDPYWNVNLIGLVTGLPFTSVSIDPYWNVNVCNLH